MNDNQTEDFYVALGKKLRDVRIRSGVTQETVADILDISAQQYQKYEYGDSPIPAARLQALSVFFNVPVSQLLGLPLDIRSIPQSHQTTHIAQVIGQLPVPIINKLLSLAQVIRQEVKN